MNTPSPLAKKLLMKSGQNWLIWNAPENYPAILEPLPENVQLVFEISEKVTGIQVFVKHSTELTDALAQLKTILQPDTVLWIIYPKKNKGIDTDLEMMGSWDIPKQYQLQPVASAAVNEVWTALRFRPDSLVKQSDFSAASIKQNDHSAYINTETKQVTLPPDLEAALTAAPAAFDIFQSLAWSHKKEYVVWILSAKQEKTRTDRIAKMLEMLLSGKKNPSAK